MDMPHSDDPGDDDVPGGSPTSGGEERRRRLGLFPDRPGLGRVWIR